MASGFEIAGLVLAMLPLVIEGVKTYKESIDDLRHDDQLKDDYNDLWVELWFLKRRLKTLVDRLPDLCADCKKDLTSDPSLWDGNESVKRSLLTYFGGEQDDLDAFLHIMETILRLVDQLMNERSLQLGTQYRDPAKLQVRLKKFVSLRQSGAIRGTLRERIRFLMDSKSRTECLQAFKTWNKKLDSMLSLVEPEKTVRSNTVARSQANSEKQSSIEEGRRILHALMDAARIHWDCACSIDHEAMLCLDVKPLSENGSKRIFDFLVKGASTTHSVHWFEGRFVLHANSLDDNIEVFDFVNLCDSIDEDAGEVLQLLVDVSRSNQNAIVKQLRPRPNRYGWLNKGKAQNLRQSLEAEELQSLRDKRMLALSFAYAMLQFHGSQCISDTIQKEAIFFYALTENLVDFSRPFLQTQFSRLPQLSTAPSIKVQHRNPAIMNLGILLIELDKGRLFSELRQDGLTSPTANQDLRAAKKLVDSIEYPDYRDAVRACLDTSWVRAGLKVDLSNSDICEGFIDAVIQPLRQEADYLWNIRI